MIDNYVASGGLVRPTSSFEEHYHSRWEVVFYTYGEGILWVDELEISFKPGTIVCIPPGARHREQGTECFKNNWLAVDTVTTEDASPVVIRESPDHPVFSLVQALRIEHAIRKPGSDIISSHLFAAVRMYFVRWADSPNRSVYISRMQRRIGEHLGDPDFSIAEGFDDIPLSRDHARRLFRKELGKSPKEYQQEIRITLAKELLDEGAPVKEVSMRCGFEDQYYFSRLFKKLVGVAPSFYNSQSGRATAGPDMIKI